MKIQIEVVVPEGLHCFDEYSDVICHHLVSQYCQIFNTTNMWLEKKVWKCKQCLKAKVIPGKDIVENVNESV